jgi:hypothetical protein
MNRCWQVARTYHGRWRFWIFGGAYAFYALWMFPRHLATIRESQIQAWVAQGLLLSMILASAVGCLAALHLRRLLSGPAAHAVPGFWGPHLLVGAVASLAIWVAVPWAQADLAGLSPLRVIALDSLAGTLGALVLLWPRAIFLLGLIPASLVWVATQRPGSALLIRFFEGEMPIVSIAAIVLAIVAYPIAALILFRTRDRTATFSDDLVIDRSHEIASRWKQPLLQLRDAAIDWRLGGAGHFTWPLRRWLIPCAVSWTEIGLLLGLVIVVMTATGLASWNVGGAWIVAAVAGITVLFIPLSSWRFRCMALTPECIRPVTRRQFVRQFMSAMLWDFAVWTAVAALVSALGYLPLFWGGAPDVLKILGTHAVGLWSTSVLLYGTALATIRLRYWLPWFLGLLMGSIIGAAYLLRLSLWLVKEFNFVQRDGVQFGLVVAVFSGIGLLLGFFTYRRWLRMDLA